jgi:hypothetical protein
MVANYFRNSLCVCRICSFSLLYANFPEIYDKISDKMQLFSQIMSFVFLIKNVQLKLKIMVSCSAFLNDALMLEILWYYTYISGYCRRGRLS